MDYVNETTEVDDADTGTIANPALDPVSQVGASHDEATAFLQELLPTDVNLRRRVITALLRALLTEKKGS